MWIVVFYIVTSTGQWTHGECTNIGNQNPDNYVYLLNNYYWEGDYYAQRGQTIYTWLPCNPNVPLHELEQGIQ